MALKDSPPGNPPKKKRWRRRIAYAALSFFCLLILLVIAAPSLALNGFVEGKVSDLLAQQLGRPVAIEGIRFGWLTPFRIERIELAPIDGEDDLSAFHLKDVRSTFSLGKIFRGMPIQFGEFEIGSIEANMIRLPDGEWNFDAMMERLAPEDDGEEEEEEPDAEPSGEAPSFPVDFSRIEIKSMNFRVIDAAEGLRAGYENGGFSLTWQGGTSPLEMKVDGELRAGDRLMPWDIAGTVSDWIDGDRKLRMDAIRLAVDGGAGDTASDGNGAEEERGAGEFRLAASLVENDPGSLAGRLPLAPWVEWARGVPQAAELPEIDGQIDLDATVSHRDGLQRAEIGAEIHAAASARLTIDGEEKILPEQRLDLSLASAIDLEAQRVEKLELSMDSAPARATVTGSGLALDDFAGSEALRAEMTADLGEAAMLGAQFLHGRDVRPVEAVFTAKAELVPGVEEGSRLAFDADFSPGMLTTLSPFAEDPPWLADGPMDLSSLGFTWQGEVDAGPKNEAFAVRVEGTRGAILKLGATRANYTKGEGAEAWSASTAMGLDLTMAFDRILRRIVGGSLDDFAGALTLQASAAAEGESPISSQGSVELAGLRLQLPENEAVFEEPTTALAWDVVFDPKDSRVTLNGIDATNSFLQMKATGEASPKAVKNLAATGRFDLNALSERLVTFLQLETPPSGVVEFEAGANGEIGKALDASLRLETPEPIEYAQPELIALSLPMEIAANAHVTWADEQPESVEFALSRFDVGEILSATGKGRLGLGEQPDVDAELAADVVFTPVTEMIDPAFWEQQDLAAVIEGGARLEVSVKGLLPTTDAEGRSTADLVVGGLLATTIDYLEAAQGEMTVAAEGFTDERTFTLTMRGTEPEAMVYRDSGVTELAMAQTSLGAAIGGFAIRSEIEAPGKGTIRLKLEDLSIEETQYADDTVEAQLPPLHVSGSFAVDPATTDAEVKDLAIELEGLASMAMNARYGAEGKTWAAQAHAKLGPLDPLMDYVAFAGEVAPAIADLRGEATLDLDFYGTVPEGEFDPLAGLPAEGQMKAQWSDVGLRQGEDLVVAGAAGEATVEIAPGGTDFKGALSMMVDRVEIAALESKTLEPIVMAARFEFEGMDRAEFSVGQMSVASLGFSAGASGRVQGLRHVLESETEISPADYLRMLDVSGAFKLDQSLGELSGITEGLETGGHVRVAGNFANQADRVLSFVSSMEFDGVEAHLPELFDLEGLNGSWTAGKTLPLRKGLATPKSPPPGTLSAETIHLVADPFDVESRGNAFLFEGFQTGFTMRAETENLIGGPSTTELGLSMKGNDPALSGRVQVTGLDLGRLAPQLRDLKGPEAEINAVAEFGWRMPESAEGGLLNGMTLQAATSRIGKRAFKRMLEALDPEQEDPRIQKAITALSLGRPSAVNVELRDSLLTFGAELETLGGIKVPLPIIERQSLGDVEQVYKLDEFTPMVGMARTALLLLLSQDFETFERHLNALESTP